MPRSWVPALLGAAVVASAGSAKAFERQWHVGGGLGAATFASGDPSLGPALGVFGAYGLSDMFDARLELTASRHERASGTSVDLYSASAGVAYKIDVIEWIPYVGLLLGYYRQAGEDPTSGDRGALGISTALGIDYALSRSVGLGLQLRYHGGLNDVPTSLTDGSYYTGLLRAEYRWGW